MSKIKNGGLDQYGAELFEQRQFGTTGVKVVNTGSRTWTQGSRIITVLRAYVDLSTGNNWSRLVLLRSSVITVGDETIPLTGYFMDGIPPLAKCGWVPFTDLRLWSMATK